MNIGLRIVSSLFAVVGLGGPAVAGSILVNFDSVAVTPGSFVDATSYLGTFGIGFVAITSGATPAIFNTTGLVVTAQSPPNAFGVNAPNGNAPISYELTFSQPLTSFSFWRITEASANTMPPYTISALDSLSNVLSSFSEPSGFGTPAVFHTLNGPGIVAIRVDADNSSARTIADPFLDTLILTTPAPEPGSVIFCCLGLSVLLGAFILRHRAMTP
jgi:hypothetical protein